MAFTVWHLLSVTVLCFRPHQKEYIRVDRFSPQNDKVNHYCGSAVDIAMARILYANVSLIICFSHNIFRRKKFSIFCQIQFNFQFFLPIVLRCHSFVCLRAMHVIAFYANNRIIDMAIERNTGADANAVLPENYSFRCDRCESQMT